MARLTRRRLTLLVFGTSLAGLVLLVVGGYFGATRTETGRGLIRDLVVQQLAPKVHGKLYVGRIGGGIFGDFTIDSLEIRGEDDSLFVATGPIAVTFDPRDLADKRILIRSLDVRRPVVHVKQFPDGEWNYRRIFPEGPKGPKSVALSYGDFIIIDTTTVHDASFTMTQVWSPNDSLRGAKRDSAVRANLDNALAGIHREGAGFMRSYRWRHGFAASGHIRLAHPDSAGMYFRVSRMDATETYPPFKFSGIRGEIRRVHDSIWVDVPRFDLIASTGRARGKIVWGSGLPVRYDLHVTGDSVSMSDIAWIYPTLPRTGGGRTLLHIRNNPRDLRVIEYALTDMDLRTTRSRLRGNMTFGVGDSVLVVKDLALRADSIDFDLLRTLNGKPFPYDWQGKLTGTLRATGGPVNRFRVEDAAFTFADANVPGAVSRARARGELDILFPAFTAFRGLTVETDRVDLRTIRFLNKAFAPLGGIVRGRAVLDSTWLDVRFREADVEHVDGPAPPSRFTGGGRVTWGPAFMTYDVDLIAAPLSLTTLARSYPYLPFRGLLSGPLKARGTADQLFVETDLSGPAGRFAWSGLVDTDSSSYAAAGDGRFDAVDLRVLLDRPRLAQTVLNGRFTMDLRGDSLPNLAGSLDLQIARSLADSVSIFPSRAIARFDNGVVRVDSLRIESSAAIATASGAFGLAPGRSDSLRFDVRVDSLGGVRRYLASSTALTADSLGGTLSAAGVLVGAIDSASLSVELAGRGLQRNTIRAASLLGQLDLENAFGARHGTGSLTLDSVTVANLRFPKVSVEGAFLDTLHTTYSATARGINGTQLASAGRVTRAPGATEIAIDTVRVLTGTSVWNLQRGGRATITPFETRMDSLVLRERRGGRIAVHAILPESAGIHGEIAGDSVALADLALLLQRPDTLQGLIGMSLELSGTRERPVIQLRAGASGVSLGTARIDSLAARGSYVPMRLQTSIDWIQAGRTALAGTLSIPIDLALAPRGQRLLDEPLRGTVRADSTDLSIIQALTTAVDSASGRLTMNIDIGGTARKPVVNGFVRLNGGEAHAAGAGEARIRELAADVVLLGDTLEIRRLSGVSDRAGRETFSLTGRVGFSDLDDPTFDLQLAASNFHAIANRRIADLWVSGNLRLIGSALAAVLTGAAEVNRGSVYIPELVQKRVVRLDDPALYDVVDTSLFGTRALLPTPSPLFVRNLVVSNARLTMGPDVWLRSSEASINLGGSVLIDRVRDARDTAGVRLTLDGSFQTLRGTYRLNLVNLVQRTFDVEGGTIRFFPDDPTLNPTLNISAVHTVRQVNNLTNVQQDRRIRVTIGGTLTTPRLSFSSADNVQLSESDLISYLITGAPAFGIGAPGQSSALGTASNFVFTTLGSAISDVVSGYLGQLGIRPDVFQIQAGVNRSAAFQTGLASSLFEGTRFGAGKQIGSRTFISSNVGLCPRQLFSQSADFAAVLRQSLGLKIEQRLDSRVSLSAGIEPSTAGLLCQTGVSETRGFTQTPTQFGLDVVRRWRF